MKFLTIAIILLSLLGLRSMVGGSIVEVQGVEKCTMPRKFEGKFKLNVKATGPFGNAQQVFGKGTIHVDADNGRAAGSETVYARGQTTKVDVIMTEADKKTTSYMVIPELKRCSKSQINAPLLPDTLPKNITLHVREGVLGGVPVQVWEAEVKEGEAQAHVEVYLTQDTCMLMSVHMKVLVKGGSMTVTETFSDMKEGIQDEGVFPEVPEYCVQSGDQLGGGAPTPGDQHHSVHHHRANRVHPHHEHHLQHATTRHRVRRHLGF